MISAPKPVHLIKRLNSVVPIVTSVFAKHGLQLNFKAGKSELLIALRGEAARKLKVQLLVQDGGVLKVADALGATRDVLMTDAYRHLGGIVDAQGSMSRELQHRAAVAGAALRPLATSRSTWSFA